MGKSSGEASIGSRILLFFFWACVAAFLLPCAVIAYWVCTDLLNETSLEDTISRSALRAMKVGEILPLKDIVKKPIEGVCVLTPYVLGLSGDSDLARRVNDRVQSSRYETDDALWYFAIVKGKDVRLQRITGHLADVADKAPNMPADFRPAECVSIARGAILKFTKRDRDHLVLGEAPMSGLLHRCFIC